MRRTLVVLVFAVVCAAPAPRAAQPTPQCGGEERWPVKVGSDPGATLVDVSNPVTTTIHELVLIPRPTVPNDDTTRVPAERVVRIVDGRLIQFKLEGGKKGDLDYHLVISDDTLQFSKGGMGTTASPHSFVAEIVNPDCVPGRHGSPGTTSVFATQLQAVYDKFRAQFTNISSGWNDGNDLPVRITGVTFFDRPHGQTGRSPNGLEIHPVLDIDFTPVPVTPPATSLIISNASFESGVQSWTASAGVITQDNREPARTGTWKAWLGGYGETHTDTLTQTVTLPSSAQALTLEFYLHVSTEEENLEPYDKLRVRLRDTNGQFIATLKTFSNLQASPGFSRQTFNLTPYEGRTLRIELVCEEDNSKMTSFVVDDFGVIVEGGGQ
jgi:hypothetical protein